MQKVGVYTKVKKGHWCIIETGLFKHNGGIYTKGGYWCAPGRGVGWEKETEKGNRVGPKLGRPETKTETRGAINASHKDWNSFFLPSYIITKKESAGKFKQFCPNPKPRAKRSPWELNGLNIPQESSQIFDSQRVWIPIFEYLCSIYTIQPRANSI